MRSISQSRSRLSVIWTEIIAHRLIPQSEIDATVGELIREFGAKADKIARLELSLAMRCSDRHEIGRWRRIRNAIAKRAYRFGKERDGGKNSPECKNGEHQEAWGDEATY